jgi:alginate O-acetyltransferase complex protein AlgI
MLLHTPVYLLFLGLTVLLYWKIQGDTRRKIFLLVVSYVFYALFDLRFLALLLGLSVLIYWTGKLISASTHPRRYAWASVVINLAVLGVFKYFNFFINSLTVLVKNFGIRPSLAGLQLLLPIGISFYTFQAISYTTEVYRQKIKPADHFYDFALYLAFFPKIIAGPLVRPRQFFEQLRHPPSSIRLEAITPAFYMILLGFIKKVLIADNLASLSDIAFRAADLSVTGGQFPSPIYIFGFYLYAFEIYADFSGYTDIARGSAALLGYSLPENFQQPYLSLNLTAFWNRWHMSLTQWFREYFFFPISRAWLKKTGRKRRWLVQNTAILSTMLVIGLWHGFAWTFLIWGLYHGILLCIENLREITSPARGLKLISGVITFHLVGLSWVIFRSSSLNAALSFIKGLFSFSQMTWLSHYYFPIMLTAILVFAIDLVSVKQMQLPKILEQYGRPVMVIAALVLLASLFVLSVAHGADTKPFIYGRF